LGLNEAIHWRAGRGGTPGRPKRPIDAGFAAEVDSGAIIDFEAGGGCGTDPVEIAEAPEVAKPTRRTPKKKSISTTATLRMSKMVWPNCAASSLAEPKVTAQDRRGRLPHRR